VKVFLDTNVLASGFATRGLCADVIRPVLAEHVVTGSVVLKELARIIHDGSSRNRAVARRDGHAEPREGEACLKQHVETLRGEPARQDAFHAACWLVAAANPRLQ
jgi:hypothetical protein